MAKKYTVYISVMSKQGEEEITLFREELVDAGSLSEALKTLGGLLELLPKPKQRRRRRKAQEEPPELPKKKRKRQVILKDPEEEEEEEEE